MKGGAVKAPIAADESILFSVSLKMIRYWR